MMATAKPVYSPPEDLTHCGICNDIINEPKALSCLHTFCLECLKEWSQPSRDFVTCPITTCKKTTTMPSDGVEDLPGNVFVSSLIERSQLQGKYVPCMCCQETNTKVLARCFDCKGFICQKGVDLHREMLLESHQVIMLDDIMSGKVDLMKLADKKPPICNEHEGQYLWLYCKTCGVLICRDCTVIDHQKSGHNYVTLKSIATEQRSMIKRLIEESEVIDRQINKGLNDTAEVKTSIDTNRNKVIAEIDKEIANIKKAVDKICDDERKRLLNRHQQLVFLSEKSITLADETLQKQKTQSWTAREMAIQVLKSASDHDIASVYRQLCSSLQELCKIQPAFAPRDIAALPKFTASSKITHITSIGTLNIGTTPVSKACPDPSVSSGTWIFESQFGKRKAICISNTPTEDIAITNRAMHAPIKVFSSSGNLKLTLSKESSGAWQVVVSSEGHFYGSCGGGLSPGVIRIFGSDGRYVSKFAAISPAGFTTDEEKTELKGLAINHKNQLLIGEVKTKYISIHYLNGVHVTSFKVNISPCYIATTSDNDIIVSANSWWSGVQILDGRGTLKQTINAPKCVSGWCPTGVCCSINDEICISNVGTPKGVYCFTSTGEYTGCITSDVQYPCGVTLLEKDQKMAVAEDDNCVKIFCRE